MRLDCWSYDFLIIIVSAGDYFALQLCVRECLLRGGGAVLPDASRAFFAATSVQII